MLFTFGKIFFPTMLHREKALRARMRWVATVFGLILVVGVAIVIGYIQKTRPGNASANAPLKIHKPPQ
jgi:quinol-cytochrome oxidoreductase complex cytochrome b subunit